MSMARWIGVLVFTAVVSVSAYAEGILAKHPDARLDSKVTLTVDHQKLVDVAKSLTEQTGVTLMVGSSKRDWRVIERRMTIHAKDVSLRAMLEGLSKLLRYRVTQGGKEGAWTYLIWQDAKARQLEEEMVASDHEAKARKAREAREAVFDMADDALKMSPDEALRQKDHNPMLAYLGGTKAGRGFARLLSAMRGMQSTQAVVRRGGWASAPISEFSSDLLGAVSDSTAGGYLAAARRGSGNEYSSMVPEEVKLMFLDSGSDSSGMVGMAMVLAQSSEKWTDMSKGGGLMSRLLLADPNSPLSDATGKMLFDLDAGASLDEASRRYEVDSVDSAAASLACESPTEKDPPTDPELTREIEIGEMPDAMWISVPDPDPMKQAQSVQEISRAAGVTVVFESFAKTTPIALYVKKGKQPFYKVLIGLEKAGFTWKREGGLLLVRPADWAFRRHCEIPDGFIEHYRAIVERRGALSIDDVGEIAVSLNDDQLGVTLRDDPVLKFAGGSLMSASGDGANLPRFYGMLSSQQKLALRTPAGLSFTALSGPQFDFLCREVEQTWAGMALGRGSVRLDPSLGRPWRESYLTVFEIAATINGGDTPSVMRTHIAIPTKDGLLSLVEYERKMRDAQAKAYEEQQQKAKQVAPAK